jgi:hypothetical protein
MSAAGAVTVNSVREGNLPHKPPPPCNQYQFGPSPRQFGPSPRQFGPSPRQFGPSPRQSNIYLLSPAELQQQQGEKYIGGGGLVTWKGQVHNVLIQGNRTGIWKRRI